MTGSYLNTLTN